MLNLICRSFFILSTQSTRAWALASALAAFPAYSESRCVADLARVQKDFCLDATDMKNGLRYQWQVNDSAFDLKSPVCLTTGHDQGQKDIIIAIDRSASAWGADAARKKLGADSIGVARHLLNQLAEGTDAPRAGLVMFSSDASCSAYKGGPIKVNRTFPCLYVPAKNLKNSAEFKLLDDLLTNAEGLYSQGGTARSSDFTIISQLLETRDLGFVPRDTALAVMSDARSYFGKNGDPYAFMRIRNYEDAERKIVSAFSTEKMRQFELIFALSPLAKPLFGPEFIDSYQTMCGIRQGEWARDQRDCPAGSSAGSAEIKFQNPASWPINKLDPRSLAEKIVQASGEPNTHVHDAIEVDDLDVPVKGLKRRQLATLDRIEYSVDGDNFKEANFAGDSLAVDSIRVATAQNLTLRFHASGQNYDLPIAIATTRVSNSTDTLTDREMSCAAETTASESGDGSSLLKMQGGAASCGVLGGHGGIGPWLFLMPLAFFLIGLRGSLYGFALIAGLSIIGPKAIAEEQGGINALNYRPTVGGVAMTESAETLNAWHIHAGLFTDYANDVIELGGEKNKRIDSVMDNLVTSHAIISLGLTRDLTFGAHVPIVHRGNLDRSVDGAQSEGGEDTQMADTDLHLKYNLYRSRALYVALLPMATIATGDSEALMGDGTNNYGLALGLSGARGRLLWAHKLGYLQRAKALELVDDRAESVTIRGQFHLDGGLEYRTTSTLSFGGNLSAKINSGDTFDLLPSNPAEWLGMAKYRPLRSDWELSTGFGTGLGKGIGAPDYRVFAGVSYVPQPYSSSSRRYVARRTRRR